MEIVVKKRVFDLEKFERVTLEGKTDFEPVKSAQEAVAHPVIANDNEKFLGVVNEGLRRAIMRDAKSRLVSENAGSMKVISQFCNTFRFVPPYSGIENRKEQTKAIYAFVRGNDVLFQAIKAAAQAALAAGEVDDEDEDDGAEE